jgi:hypothetical protein
MGILQYGSPEMVWTRLISSNVIIFSTSIKQMLAQHIPLLKLYIAAISLEATAVAQWLSHCTTNQKVAGSIPDGVNFSLT